MKKTTYVLIAVVGLTLLSAAAAPFVWLWNMKQNPDMQIFTREEAAETGLRSSRIISGEVRSGNSDDDTASDTDETSDSLRSDIVIITSD